jgi:hypothetical protein
LRSAPSPRGANGVVGNGLPVEIMSATCSASRSCALPGALTGTPKADLKAGSGLLGRRCSAARLMSRS